MSPYLWADMVIYPLLYHVVRYRRRVVRENLVLSFPEKGEEEIVRIEKGFYRHLADVAVEIVYGKARTREEMVRHIVYEGMEQAAEAAKARGGAIVMVGHMGCWEWLPTAQRHLTDGQVLGLVYRRQKNAKADRWLIDRRLHLGGICIEKQQLLRQMVRMRRDKEPLVLGLIADQKPRPEVTRTYSEFLHQRTGWLDGGEVLARKFDYPVYYAHITCPERGRYKVQILPLTDTPQESEEGEITRQYAKALEKNIHEQPEQWLWSHNRWKWTRDR